MNLEKYHNKIVRVRDVDHRTFSGLCVYENKDDFDEVYDALSIKVGLRWIRLFENEIQSILILIDDCEYVYCPVCGTLTAVYDICDSCSWENTGETNIDGGPNKMTLAEARKAYAEGLPIQ